MGEMKANELMIGDWVRHANGTPMQVTRIDYCTENKGHFACGTPHHWEYNNKFEPIPLTPEILTKNGFYKVDYGVDSVVAYEWKDPNQNATVEVFYYKYLPEEEMRIEVVMGSFTAHHPSAWRGYVHWLQHALRLCGIEKEVVV